MSAEAARFLNGDPENYDEHIDPGGEARQINMLIENLHQDNREIGEGLVVKSGARLDKKHLCLVVTLILVLVIVLIVLTMLTVVIIVFLSSSLHHITAHSKVHKSMPNSHQSGYEQECRPGTYGVACSEKCPNCFNDTCDPATGKCLHGCKAGLSGKLCNEECRPGTYGVACSEKCPNCFNDTCDPATGKCLHECKAGWSGKLCNEVQMLEIAADGISSSRIFIVIGVVLVIIVSVTMLTIAWTFLRYNRECNFG